MVKKTINKRFQSANQVLEALNPQNISSPSSDNITHPISDTSQVLSSHYSEQE